MSISTNNQRYPSMPPQVPPQSEDIVQLLARRREEMNQVASDSATSRNEAVQSQIQEMAQINSGFKAELKKQSRELSRLREHDTRKSELEKEMIVLKKNLKEERRQREQFESRLLEEQRTTEKGQELRLQKERFQEELNKIKMQNEQLTLRCEQLEKVNSEGVEKLKLKSEEVSQLLRELDSLKVIKRELAELQLKSSRISSENENLRQKMKLKDEEIKEISRELRHSSRNFNSEISKIQSTNDELLSTVNTQNIELQDAIQLANHFKETMEITQDQIAQLTQKQLSTNMALTGMDQLIRNSGPAKVQFLKFKGDPEDTEEILHVLKTNVVSFIKLFQDVKHSKNKYKSKRLHLGEDIKEFQKAINDSAREFQEFSEQKQQETEQQENIILELEGQLKERDNEEQKLQQQIEQLSERISELEREIEDKESSRFKTICFDMASYIYVLHGKLGILSNYKAICGDFVSSYLEILEKTKKLSNRICGNSSNMGLVTSRRANCKERLRKTLLAVFFLCILGNNKPKLRYEAKQIRTCIRRAKDESYTIDMRLLMNSDFQDIIMQLNTQQESLVKYNLVMSEFDRIVEKMNRFGSAKDKEIENIQMKLLEINKTVCQLTDEKAHNHNSLKDSEDQQTGYLQRIQELQVENSSLKNQIAFHRNHFIQQSNDESNGWSASNNNENNINSLNQYAQNISLDKKFLLKMNQPQYQSNNLINQEKYSTNNNNLLEDQSQEYRPLQYQPWQDVGNTITFSNNNNNSNISSLQQPLAKRNSLKESSFTKYQHPQQQQQPQQEQLNQRPLLSDDKKTAYLELKKQQQLLQDRLNYSPQPDNKPTSGMLSKLNNSSSHHSSPSNNFNPTPLASVIKNTSFIPLQQSSQESAYQQYENSTPNQLLLLKNNNNNNSNYNSNKSLTIHDQIKQELADSQQFTRQMMSLQN